MTERLLLEPCSNGHLRMLIEREAAFHKQYGWRIVPGYLDFPGALLFSLQKIENTAGASEVRWWAPFLFIHRKETAVIGFGGYKGPPDEEGAVEIGYSIAPDYRGRGFATEAARELIRHAFLENGVTAVRAHTLPAENASTRVLQKCGFSKISEFQHPVDGLVWRWEIQAFHS